jgi:hypothetical protein
LCGEGETTVRDDDVARRVAARLTGEALCAEGVGIGRNSVEEAEIDAGQVSFDLGAKE